MIDCALPQPEFLCPRLGVAKGDKRVKFWDEF